MKDISLRHAAIIAALGLLLMAIVAPIANFSVLGKLVIPGDAAKTATNIFASQGLFRLGVFFFLIVAMLDIVVAWALYIFLKPINTNLSLLVAWMRVVYATILIAYLIFLTNALQLATQAEDLSAFTTNQIQVQILLSINTFNFGWQLGLIVFGFHLLLLGYLIFKAGYMRKILGVLLIISALGYIIDGFGKVLNPNYNVNIAMFTFVGEVVLIFWLLIKGANLRDSDQHPLNS